MPKKTDNENYNQADTKTAMPDDWQRIIEARHHDPFSVLGKHADTIRAFIPGAAEITLAAGPKHAQAFTRIANTDCFSLTSKDIPAHYQLTIRDSNDIVRTIEDPYRFGPQLGDIDLHLFNEGNHRQLYNMLGSHQRIVDNIEGTLFAVWAPGAERISVVGDFNQWDGRIHPMRSRGESGVWELFLPAITTGSRYKFEIRNSHGDVQLKQDPFANEFELRPGTASVTSRSEFLWSDQAWLDQRCKSDWQSTPCSIYEVHLGSWQRTDDNQFHNYKTLAHKLAEYVKYTGFTHIELLPVTEHPLDDSWGYQVTGYFAATSRFGTPDELRYFVNHCHNEGIGVLLDWVPAHFPRDAHSLAKFDGTALFEHQDPRRGEHRDWGTLIFNYSRNEVRNFLIASALYWLREFHIDGLRVDAVASMLYLDYSREDGDWLPNHLGGRENLEAIEFLKQLNSITQTELPGTLIIAEESTSWPQVSRPPETGGLGFTMKWNMGWMHDSLEYFQHDSIHRSHHHHTMTFGLIYAFTENFVLPYSHDEVVHGKGSMLSKMPGDDWQQFANLRLVYSAQFTLPGKKLLFQGLEFAQRKEWDFKTELDWHLTDAPSHRGVMTLVADLNRLYTQHPALHELDFDPAGFEWIEANDSDNSVLCFYRHAKNQTESLIVLLNCTPVPRDGYNIGVSNAGTYIELFNSDNKNYGGSNFSNSEAIVSYKHTTMNRENTLSVKLPPLAAIVLKYVT